MERSRPAGLTFLAVFFAFGVTMSSLSALLLMFPGTPLDVVWRLNPPAQQGFSRLGFLGLVLMLVVSVACGVAALGIWRLRVWGFIAGLILLLGNAAGDLTNAFVFHDARTLIGIPIAAAMAAYLFAQRRLFLARR